MEREEAEKLLECATFRFAKTMPTMPHSYTVRDTWENEAEFEQVVAAVQQHGESRRFRGRTYRYLVANGFQYWTMGASPAKTILINRATP